eukprot:411290_1
MAVARNKNKKTKKKAEAQYITEHIPVTMQYQWTLSHSNDQDIAWTIMENEHYITFCKIADFSTQQQPLISHSIKILDQLKNFKSSEDVYEWKGQSDKRMIKWIMMSKLKEIIDYLPTETMGFSNATAIHYSYQTRTGFA